jgi:hypothetical protein
MVAQDVVLELTDREADLLVDIVNCWIETHEEAEQQVQDDRTHESVEDMLNAVESIKQQGIDAIVIRERLLDAKRAASVSRSRIIPTLLRSVGDHEQGL